ncbi:MAG: hypothetical protein ACHQF2_04295 [Flavobacteriales bacterium]
MQLLSLFFMFSLILSCGKGEDTADISNKANEKAEEKEVIIKLPEEFIKDWLEYHLESSIVFDVCNPRTIKFEQGGTEFFWMTLGDKNTSTKYRIHRLNESEGLMHVYATPKGSLAGTDTTLIIMEHLTVTAGIMRVRQFGRASDYPKEGGTIYFVGDQEIVSSNPSPEECPD